MKKILLFTVLIICLLFLNLKSNAGIKPGIVVKQIGEYWCVFACLEMAGTMSQASHWTYFNDQYPTDNYPYNNTDFNNCSEYVRQFGFYTIKFPDNNLFTSKEVVNMINRPCFTILAYYDITAHATVGISAKDVYSPKWISVDEADPGIGITMYDVDKVLINLGIFQR